MRSFLLAPTRHVTCRSALLLVVFFLISLLLISWIHHSSISNHSSQKARSLIKGSRLISTVPAKPPNTRGSNYVNSTSLQRYHHTNPPITSDGATNSRIRRIYAATRSWINFDALKFENCDYKNCQSSGIKDGANHRLSLSQADVAVFEFFRFKALPELDFETRQRQLWAIVSHECYAYEYNRWSPIVNGRFNLSMTFRQDSEFFYPFGRYVERSIKASGKVAPQIYVEGKAKAAFAYVSRCHSRNYNRLGLMKALQKHIQVDIFGGCTGKQPCSTKVDDQCEAEKHKQYRFFLSFENSLCRDYITEKFWNRLSSDAFFVPVVVGGTSIQEYSSIAPPNSFIHAYNFSSVEALGKYLKYLTINDTAYSEYHSWRDKYQILTSTNQMISCKLCKLANTKPYSPPRPDLKEWWESGSVGHLPYDI